MDVVLALVSALLGAVTVGTVLTAELSRARARLRVGGLRDVELGYYDLAYLAGGPARVADTALGLLSREGEIRVTRGGKLHRVRGAVSAGYPVEQRVLAIMAGRSVGQPAVRVKREVAGSAEVAEIRDRLVGLGLLVDPQAVAGYRVCQDLLRWTPGIAVGGMVVNVIVMIIMGSPELSVASLLGFGASWLVAKKIRPLYARSRRVTLGRAGRHHVEKARREHPHGVVADAVAMPLALYGLSHLGDPALSAEISTRAIPDGHLSGHEPLLPERQHREQTGRRPCAPAA
ncbi:TIGR04222 domain-containing membrane protein, partial [Nonomuraea sp. NPDC049784]|uniref:TIGR04222 domain-containing membrane protein n=1 Tax=Nonomuraea sp. NPDC049784 TaxID=3154361 RepID=UPI00340E81C2